VAPGRWIATRSTVWRAGRFGLRQKKGAIEQLDTAPPSGSVVVCLDEMGPQAAKSFPGQQLVKPAAPKAERAKHEIDYGRRDVAGYVVGAFKPASGEAFTHPYDRRTTTNWVDFLGAVEPGSIPWSSGSMRSVTTSVLTARRTCGCSACSIRALEFVFQPTYAAYLNRIASWWKGLRSLALKGRRFETWAEIEQAVERATAYWNEHKHPFVWGRRRRHRQSRRFGVAALPAISLI
jgi:hypothetical protein